MLPEWSVSLSPNGTGRACTPDFAQGVHAHPHAHPLRLSEGVKAGKDPVVARRAERTAGTNETFGPFALNLVDTILDRSRAKQIVRAALAITWKWIVEDQYRDASRFRYGDTRKHARDASRGRFPQGAMRPPLIRGRVHQVCMHTCAGPLLARTPA